MTKKLEFKDKAHQLIHNDGYNEGIRFALRNTAELLKHSKEHPHLFEDNFQNLLNRFEMERK